MILSWKTVLAEHRKPTVRRSVWQIVNTLVPYVSLWGLMIWTVDISYRLWDERRKELVGYGRLRDRRRVCRRRERRSSRQVVRRGFRLAESTKTP